MIVVSQGDKLKRDWCQVFPPWKSKYLVLRSFLTTAIVS